MVTRLLGAFRAWKPNGLTRQIIATIAGLVAALTFLLAIGLGSHWQRESECSRAGGKLRGTCLPTLDHCQLGSKRFAIGTVFRDGCNSCECTQHDGIMCRWIYCNDFETQPVRSQDQAGQAGR